MLWGFILLNFSTRPNPPIQKKVFSFIDTNDARQVPHISQIAGMAICCEVG